MNRSVQIAVAWIVAGVVWLLVLTFHQAPKILEEAQEIARYASSQHICIFAGSDLRLHPWPATKQQVKNGFIVPRNNSYCGNLKTIGISAEPLFFIKQDFLPEDWCDRVDALEKHRKYRACQRAKGPNNEDCAREEVQR